MKSVFIPNPIKASQDYKVQLWTSSSDMRVSGSKCGISPPFAIEAAVCEEEIRALCLGWTIIKLILYAMNMLSTFKYIKYYLIVCACDIHRYSTQQIYVQIMDW